MQILTLIPVILASLPGLTAADNINDVCDQYQVLQTNDNGYVLQAKCSGQYSALPLDWCVINNDGTLAAQENGGLSGSCTQGCSIMTGIPTLNCICDPQPQDEYKHTTLDLTPTVTSNNGILECYGSKGWSTSPPAKTTVVA